MENMYKLKEDWIPLSHRADFLKKILDNMQVGVIVTDPSGVIIYINEKWAEFSNVDRKEQIGKHVTTIITNSRLHIVAQTGKAELNYPHRFKDKAHLVHRIPIKEDGKVIAVIGILLFDSGAMASKMAEKLLSLESKLHLYENELISLRSTRYRMESIVGVSEPLRQCKKQALNAAGTSLPVMITGESGTGKELFAQAIHNAGRRRFFSFVRINCSAIPRDLIESELFGYEKGAFTGARSDGKPGKFELADRGSIFLDEISDLPMEIQPKLLRVLEEKELEHVGGNKQIKTDFRLITATNQKLEEMVHQNRFRKDLFYRLNVIPLDIPPLRERREDIIPLAKHFIKQICEDTGIPEADMDPRTEEILTRYDWPGNVRQLWNLIAMVLSSLEGNRISVHHLPHNIRQTPDSLHPSKPNFLYRTQAVAEKEAILDALQSADYNKTLAARLLGIHRSALYKKMKRYNLSSRPDEAVLNSTTRISRA